MNNYLRVLSRIANTPLFVSEDKLSILSTNVIVPILTSGKPFSDVGVSPTDKKVEPKGKTAIINVFDSLVAKGGAGESGFTSYEGITNKINQAINAGASKLGFYLDSPGGEVSGLFPLTDFIHSLPSIYGIETFSFTDGTACSACYAIAGATQRRYASSTAQVGSIGVIMSLVDVTKLDEKMGVSYTILRSKSEKALYNPHESLSEEVITKYSAVLSELDTIFNEKMASYNPNLSVKAIQDMKGNSFLAGTALELGLIDEIVSSMEDVISKEGLSISTTTKGNVMTLEELKAQVSALETENAALKASVANAGAQAVANERARCLDILTAGQALNMSSESVNKRISAGTDKEASLEIFTAIAEGIGKASAIDTSTPISATVDKVSLQLVDKVTFAGEEYGASDIVAAGKAFKGVK